MLIVRNRCPSSAWILWGIASMDFCGFAACPDLSGRIQATAHEQATNIFHSAYVCTCYYCF